MLDVSKEAQAGEGIGRDIRLYNVGIGSEGLAAVKV